MPLMDHFRSPKGGVGWESIHAGWSTRIADQLNEELPTGFVAMERRRLGTLVEVDVGMGEESRFKHPPSGNGVATATLAVWSPPAADQSIEVDYPDDIGVEIYFDDGQFRLVGAIELVSPANKDRPVKRSAFVAKCASYLAAGAGLIVVDIVTERRANLHAELMELFDCSTEEPDYQTSDLYAVAYRPYMQEKQGQIDIWGRTLQIGGRLPTLPIYLASDLAAPVDLELAYTTTCRLRRLC